MPFQEFDSLPLPDIFGLMHFWQKRERRAAENAAMIACTIANVHRAEGSVPLTIDDFLGKPERNEVDLALMIDRTFQALAGSQ